MLDFASVSPVVIFLTFLVGAVSLGVLVLYWRDRTAKAQGKTPEQVNARFLAILEFRSALQRCIPGVLLIIMGAFYAIDRSRQRESDWWFGLLFIPVGWILIPLFARKSWRRYSELQKSAEKGAPKSHVAGPASTGIK